MRWVGFGHAYRKDMPPLELRRLWYLDGRKMALWSDRSPRRLSARPKRSHKLVRLFDATFCYLFIVNNRHGACPTGRRSANLDWKTTYLETGGGQYFEIV